jgi:hypothetical protein
MDPTRYGTPESETPLDDSFESSALALNRQNLAHLFRRDEPSLLEHSPRVVLVPAASAQQLETPRLGFGHDSESLTLQHDLDLISMRLVNSAEYEKRLVHRTVCVALKELGHDLVGAGKVEDGHLGQVDQGQRPLPSPLELGLDRHSDRATRGASDQV